MSLYRKLTVSAYRQLRHLRKSRSSHSGSLRLLPQLSRRNIDFTNTSPSSDSIIRQFAAKPPTVLSLSDIIVYTGSTDDKFREYGKFIHNELPIRIAHRVVELASLPYNLSHTSAVRELRELYTHSFHLFRMLESPDNKEKELLFIKEMKDHFNRLKSAVPLIANGLSECMTVNPMQAPLIKECPFLNGFLDRFHAARIGTRLLTGQYITCKEQQNAMKKSDHILGLIDFECDPAKILSAAIDDTIRICEEQYHRAPEVKIKTTFNNISFTYIPSDLYYIFFELMKNSMRAVCDNYTEQDGDEEDMPPIECVIVASQQSDDLTVKISDQGGGITREHMDKVWYYSFSTVAPEMQPKIDNKGNIITNEKAPMAGFGYGLPLSRLYAKYFGGDLELISMDGYGSDAFVYLNWLKPDDVKPLLGQTNYS